MNNYLPLPCLGWCSGSSFNLVYGRIHRLHLITIKNAFVTRYKKTRVTVSHVLNQAAVQFICSLLMGRVSVSSWVTYQQKNLQVSPADCSDQDLKGGQILDAGPSRLTLRKVTDLREIKCRAVQAPWQHWTQLFLFFWFYSSSTFAFQSVTNPRCVYNPEPSIHILLEWQFILFFLRVFFLFIYLFFHLFLLFQVNT